MSLTDKDYMLQALELAKKACKKEEVVSQEEEK